MSLSRFARLLTVIIIASASSIKARVDLGSWSTKAPMPAARCCPIGVAVGDTVYVIGGASGGAYVGTVDAYSPATDTWASPKPTSMPTPRALPGAGVIDGIIYVVGGEAVVGGVDQAVKTLEAYDPATNTWTTRASMPTARWALGVAVVDGKLYAIAGTNGSTNPTTVEVYDPATNTWSTRASIPTTRYLPAVGVINGVIYVAGSDNGGGSYSNSVDAYDPASNLWTAKAPMITPRSEAAYGVIDGVLYVAGGSTTDYATPNTVEGYTPSTNTWSSFANIPSFRLYMSSGVVNGALYAIGGYQRGPGDRHPEPGGCACYITLNEAFTPPAHTATALAVPAATATYGATATLTATLTAGGSPVSGKPISFKLAGSSVGTAATGANGVATLANVSLAGRTVGPYSITATFAGDATYSASNGSSTLTINQAVASIGWSPAGLTYPSPLGANQLNASASYQSAPVPGAFIYTPGAGTVLSGGSQTLSTTFTPTDTVNFATTTVSTLLSVTQASQTITFGALTPKTIGDPDFAVAASTSSGLTVSFAASGGCTVAGTRVHVVSAGTCTLTASQAGDTNYSAAPAIAQAFAVSTPATGIPIAWGTNASGQLGVGSSQLCAGSPCSLQALPVGSLTNVTAVSASLEGHSVALKSDGTVWAWGLNATGQLGDGTTTNRPSPVPVTGLTNVIAIAAGVESTMALKSDGTVWAWGWNGLGQVGDGTTTNRTLPTRVGSLTGIVAIAGSYAHSLALQADGTLWAWGYDRFAQLGATTGEVCNVGVNLACRRNPAQIAGVTQIVAIAAGYGHSAALKIDGTVWAWGLNDNGQLGYSTGSAFCGGDSTYLCGTTPQQVPAMTGIKALAAGSHQTLALKTDGSVWTWGRNLYGELGAGSSDTCFGNPCSKTPINVTSLGTAMAIAGGTGHSAAIKSDGTAWAWGRNHAGQLGDGTTINRSSPVAVNAISGASAISAGDGFTLAVAPPISTSLALPAATGVYGGTTSLQATLSSAGSGVAGKTVAFTLLGASAGTATTNASGVATIANVNLGTSNAGTYSNAVTATFAGEGNTLGSSTGADLTIAKANQTISFAALAGKTFGDADFSVAATASSGLPVSFSAAGNCTVSSSSVHITGGGSCTITASQIGNGNYNAALDVARTFAIAKANQTVGFAAGWSGGAPMSAVSVYSTAGVVNNVLYVTGNIAPVAASVTAYDPATNAWSAKAPMPSPRYLHGVGVVNGLLYAVGGHNGSAILSTMVAYEPVANTWTPKASMSSARYIPAVAVVNGVLYAIGGYSGSFLNSVEAYDPATNTWTARAPMPTARYGAVAGVIGGIIYVAGGSNCAGCNYLNVVEAYDPISNTWSTKAPMPTPRYLFGGGVLNGLLYAAGGYNDSSRGLSTVEAYDPAANVWTTSTPMLTGRHGFAAGVINGQLYAAGGQSAAIVNLSSTEVLTAGLTARTYGDADFTASATATSGLPVTFTASGDCTVTGSTVHLTGAGSCTITASQAGNANYNAATAASTFPIAKASQAITFAALGGKTFGNPDFTVSATASSGLAASFAATGACTVSGATVHLTGAGSCTITASQVGDANYNAAPDVAQAFSIAKANQTITFGALVDKTFGDADFSLSATTSSGLPVTFTASLACSITGATVHLMGAGACAITASQGGNGNYNPAPDVARTFAIGKANQTITFAGSSSGSWNYLTSMPAPQTATASATLNGLMYSAGGWDASHLCSYLNLLQIYDPAHDSWTSGAPMPTARNNGGGAVSGGKIYVVGGSTGCGPLTGANETYNPATNTWTSLAPMPTPRQGVGVAVIDSVLFAVGGNGGKVVEAYDIATNSWRTKAPMLVSRFGPAVAASNGHLYVFGGVDYATNPIGNVASVESYDPLTDTWSARAPMPDARQGAAAVAANGRIYVIGGYGTGLLSSVLSYDPATDQWSSLPSLNTARVNPGAASVNGVLYAFAGYNGDAYTATSHFTSVEALTLETSLGDKTFGDADFTVSATATSGLPVSFAASGACTVSGSTVHLTGAGSCTVTASQGGNGNYNAASDVAQTFSIGKANQTITFAAPTGKTFGDADFAVSATATSGLAVGFTATGACTVGGATAHLTGAGSCTVTASQGGNGNYNAAPDVAQTFSIGKANQTITFAALTGKTFGDADFMVSATASSGLPIEFGASASCVVSGAAVHLTGAGNCTITATQAGNGDYNPAPDVVRSFAIAKGNQTIGSFGLLLRPAMTTASAMSVSRGHPMLVALPDGTALVAGGDGRASAERFNPVTNAFSSTGSMSVARGTATATLLLDGRVLVAGGDTGAGVTATAEIYDPATELFTATGSMTSPRYLQTATLLRDGTVLVTGGSPNNTTDTTTAELYDPATGTFTKLPNLAVTRSGHVAALLNDGTVLIAGGGVGSPAGASAEVFDPATRTFHSTGSMSTARIYPVAATLPDGRVLVAGGYNGSTLSSAEIYDPSTQTFSATGSLATARHALSAALLPNGQVLVTGGADATGRTAELYANGTFTRIPDLAFGRYSHRMALLADGRVLIAGGSWGSGDVSSAELFRPVQSGATAFTFALSTQTFGAPDFLVSATASSELAITFAAVGPCTLTGSTVHLTGAGNCTVTASQSGDTNFNAAPDVAQAFTIAKANQTLWFAALSAKTFGAANFGVSATASSGLPVGFSAAGACTITGATVHITSAGSCTITASQAGDSNVAAAPSVSRTLTIAQAAQTITFAAVGDRTFGDLDFAIGATATSGLPVSFAAAGSCTITGSTVHLTGAGNCTITASQAGNGNYKLAPDVAQTFSIGKATQTITFIAIGTKTFGDPDFPLIATASSGLAVSFSITAGGACSVSGATVHVIAAGSCTITAAQAGNGNYNSAPSVSQALTVGKASQTITFGPLANRTFGDPDFIVGATASSGLAVSFSITAGGACSVSGATVHVIAAGSCTITAAQAGNGNYNAAVSVARSFSIAKAAQTIASLGVTIRPSFVPTGSTSSQHVNPVMIRLSDATILVAGGNTEPDQIVLATAERYDPATGLFTSTGNLNVPRTGATASLLPDGRVLVAGGSDGAHPIASAELYDPATGTFSFTGNLAVPRYFQRAITLDNGTVLIVGGSTPGDASGASAEIYDPVTGTFSRIADMQVARPSQPAASILQDGQVLVTGGTASTGVSEVFDPATRTFHPVGSLAIPRFYHSSTGLPDGRVLIAGGYNGGALASTELYDPATETFSAGPSMTAAHYAHVALPAPGGAVLIAGGSDNASPTAVAEIFGNNQFTRIADMTAARVNHRAVFLAGNINRALIVGGYRLNPGGQGVTAAELMRIDASGVPALTFPLADHTFGFADHKVSATASSGLIVTLSASGDCTMTGTTLHLIEAGICTVTASQSGDGNYTAAPPLSQSFMIRKAHAIVSLSSSAHPSVAGQPLTLSVSVAGLNGATALATGIVTFTDRGQLLGTVPLDGTGSASLSTDTLSALGSPHVLAASYSGDTNYIPEPSAPLLQTVVKADQSITFAALADATFGDADFTVSATASSGLAVAFAATGSCAVAGSSVHVTAAGGCTITASQAGDDTYNAAPDVARTFSIAKASQTISFAALGATTYGDADFAVSATASSGLGVSFSATGACNVAGSTVHITSAGNCTITATQAGDGDYNTAPDVARTFSIAKANQTITFGPLAGKTFGDPDFTVGATASSGLAVSFAAAGACAISGGTVHLTGAGNCTVTASQSGDVNYTPATDVSQPFAVSKASQSLVFASLADKTFGDGDFSVSATASSGLTVTFTAAGNCSVAVATVHLTGAGSCTITASQPGDADYNAASDASRSFAIAKASQTITFGALGDKTDKDGDFSIAASASSGLAVSFSAVGACGVTASTVHIVGAGSCTITANQPGDANYTAAAPVSRAFTIRDTTPPSVVITAPGPDAFIGSSPVLVTTQAADAVGVTTLQINGVSASRIGGTAQSGTWQALVPVSLPVAFGGSLTFSAVAGDAAANTSTAAAVIVDNDGIPASMDTVPGAYSSDYQKDAATFGAITRNGWNVLLSSTSWGVRGTIAGAGPYAQISACSGRSKSINLNVAGETADWSCSSSGTVTVQAVVASPAIEIVKRFFFSSESISLATGQIVSTGSPTTAAATNTGPVTVSLLDGQGNVIGTFQLDPSESVDVNEMTGPNGEHFITLQVLVGTVTVTLAGQTSTLQAGQPAKTFGLDARAVVQTTLADLQALRTATTDKQDGTKVDQAIRSVTDALDPSLWAGLTRLQSKGGEKVFNSLKEAATKLRELVQDKKSTIADAPLQDLLARLATASRALASTAIDDAIAGQGRTSKIDEALKERTKGDAEIADQKPESGIEHYRNAWSHAVEAVK